MCVGERRFAWVSLSLSQTMRNRGAGTIFHAHAHKTISIDPNRVLVLHLGMYRNEVLSVQERSHGARWSPLTGVMFPPLYST